MNRYRRQSSEFPRGRKSPLLSIALVLMLSACGEGPGDPRPPLSPPRPVTELGYISTAQFEVPARPVAPLPGEM